MNERIIAIVGMPGSGKSTVCSFLEKQKIPFVHFGDVTTDVLAQRTLPVTGENEQLVREELRKEHGMAVYATKSLSKIQKLFQESNVIGVDGLYSWEEYLVLCKEFPDTVVIIHVFSNRDIRYKRLANRSERPLQPKQAFARDVSEIEKLHKSGPIAMADYSINNNGTRDELYEEIRRLLHVLNRM